MCFKTKKLSVKLITLYFVTISLLFGAAEYIGLFGTSSAGAISGNGIVGLLILAVTGTIFVGVILAWVIYGLINLKKNKQKDNTD